MRNVVVTGSFDNLGSSHVRFLEEASKLGRVHVMMWSDKVVRSLEGKAPEFPAQERLYLLQGIRYVGEVRLVTGQVERDAIPQIDEAPPEIWAVDEASDTAQKRTYCESRGVQYRVLSQENLKGLPLARFKAQKEQSLRKKVIVAGCFDWFHSGHVRFFEEVSQLGDSCLSGCFSKPQLVVYGHAAPSVSENLARVSVDVRYRRGLPEVSG